MVVFWLFLGEFLLITLDNVRPLHEGVLPLSQGTQCVMGGLAAKRFWLMSGRLSKSSISPINHVIVF